MKRTPLTVHARGSDGLRPAATGRRLARTTALVAGVTLLILQLLAASAFAAITDPEYTKPILDPATQPRWVSAIPNALMAAFTYNPHTPASAAAAGFPASANCGVAGPGGEDCYTIQVRQFPQNLGLVDETTGLPLTTTVWGYGSLSNAPAVGPFVGGVWHSPAPTFKNTANRPTRITWLNELPNVEQVNFDPSYNCGPNAPNCYPYNRIVTHVHGAHVLPDSDGNPEAWYTPGFTLTGSNYEASPYGPPGTYRYINTQEAATVWYHDHAMGLTHLNTDMGMAGFYLITDDNEKCLQGATGITGCPGGTAKVLPTDPYEVGYALQDRNFWPDGSLAMPDLPIRDLLSPTCQKDVTGASIPETCPTVPFSKAADGHLIPYNAAIPDPALRGPFTGKSGTLEYFGNIPMVNGVIYGKYDVEPRFYRMRLIGGTDSRTWVIKLINRTTGLPIPIWQIGSEQGLLNNPVNRTAGGVDLMPGERVDLLVDFRGITAGTKVVMQNLGPDGPYEGPFVAAVPSTLIPEIMEFNLIAINPAVADITVPPAGLQTVNLRPILGQIAPLTVTAPTRNVSLIEITDQLGRTMPTIDSRGYMAMGIPITETIKLNDVEQWDIINTTVDAHPMHLHLVAFQVIDRVAFDPLTFVPPVSDTVNNVFRQPTYTAVGAPTPPFAWEAGWKDTVACPPGMVTRVKAKFDIAGLYVWHCHILSHEEHDMMRTFVVSDRSEYTITTAAGAGGGATPITGSLANDGFTATVAAGAASVPAGSTVTYNFTPGAGNEVSSLVVDGAVITGNLTSYTLVGVTANHYINVYFKPIPNTVTVGVGAGGTVTGGTAGANLVRTGTALTINFVPNANFEVDSIVVDGAVTPSTALAPITSYTFTNVTANHYINVYFRAIPNTITVGVGAGGTVTGAVAGANLVASGGTLSIGFTPNAGQQVAGMVVDNVFTASDPAAPLTGYIFTGVAGNHYINVYFQAIPPAATFTINAATNNAAFGTIAAAAPAPAAPGPYAQASTVVFNITPAVGRSLAAIVVDGIVLSGPRTSYTFGNIQANHYINAYFQ